jgi:hypothetical protein
MTAASRRQHHLTVARYLAHTMHSHGVSSTDIAAHLQVTQRSVYRYLSTPIPDAPARRSATPELDSFYLDGLCGTRPDLDWYSDDRAEITEVKAVCAQCPVLQQCRAYALDDRADEWGVWGAMTRGERVAAHPRPQVA